MPTPVPGSTVPSSTRMDTRHFFAALCADFVNNHEKFYDVEFLFQLNFKIQRLFFYQRS